MTLTSVQVAAILRGIQPYTVPDDIEAVTQAARQALERHADDPSDASYQAVLAAYRKREELSK